MRKIINGGKLIDSDEQPEQWLTYTIKNPHKNRKPAPTPAIMHPVQIKNLVKTVSDNCPIKLIFLRMFHPISNEMINHNSDILGRYLQTAYN